MGNCALGAEPKATTNVPFASGASNADDEASCKSDISFRSGLTQNVIKEHVGLDVHDYYEISGVSEVLGSGLNGEVKKCTHKKTGLKYALKALRKIGLMPEKLAGLKDEIRCMASLDHPNILRIHEYFETDDVIYLILELCHGGDLLRRLQSQYNHSFSERVACHYVHTILSAIAYCHSKNVVHRDLKLENLLFEDATATSPLKLIGK